MLRRKLACAHAQPVLQVYVGFLYAIEVTSIWQMCHVIISSRNADLMFLKTHASQRCRRLRVQQLLLCSQHVCKQDAETWGIWRHLQKQPPIKPSKKSIYHFLIYIQATAHYWFPTPGTASPIARTVLYEAKDKSPSCMHVDQFPYAFLKRSTASKMSSLQHSKHSLDTQQWHKNTEQHECAVTVPGNRPDWNANERHPTSTEKLTDPSSHTAELQKWDAQVQQRRMLSWLLKPQRY